MSRFLILFFLLASFPSFAVTEDELDHCRVSEDCIVVPYRHCCGLTKRAINKKHKALYEEKKEWQKFDDPKQCALMGACLSDKNIEVAECRGHPIRRCQMKRP